MNADYKNTVACSVQRASGEAQTYANCLVILGAAIDQIPTQTVKRLLESSR
jgi:hypothetical protein